MPSQKNGSALLPLAVKVVVYGGNLSTETGFPLYRYVPLADMVRLGKPPTPRASDIVAWVSNSVPRPRTRSEVPVVAAGLGFQARGGAVRSYEQAVYRGRPLYTCADDAPSPPMRLRARYRVSSKWSASRPWVRDDGTDMPTWPSYGGGPEAAEADRR